MNCILLVPLKRLAEMNAHLIQNSELQGPHFQRLKSNKSFGWSCKTKFIFDGGNNTFRKWVCAASFLTSKTRIH